MWSNVQAADGCPSPSSRSKHAMCVSQSGSIYLLGGRSANLPLKDLWRFDPVQSVWEELKCRGNRPPCLQEHSMVCWKNSIYVFGGEIGFASTGETPLWILDTNTLTWRKHHMKGSNVHQPSGRRGHSAIMYDGFMHVFGGYQDLRGSSSELWIFDLATERWSLLMTPSYFEQPPPRHNHSCIVHDGAMWIYGGLTDLQSRGDFWKWDFDAHRWSRIKTQRGPGELHGHSAVKAMAFMYIFGGEKSGVATNDLWRFHFGTETWERITAQGIVPPPRCRHVAVPDPSLQEQNKGWGDETPTGDQVPNRPSTQPPKSISMCFGQAVPEVDGRKQHFKFRVHPVSRFCSKNTGSDEDDDEYATYNPSSAQVNLKTLRDKFHSSRLVRSISSGSYSILHNQGAAARRDELEKLVEESTPRRLPQIQKSQSSDAVLESDGESTPQHRATAATDSPPLWVENPNTLLRSSWGRNGTEATTPTARLSRIPPPALIEENGESADESAAATATGLLIDLGEPPPQSQIRASHTVADLQMTTPSIEARGLPHSMSHSSGYHSFTEEEGDSHREFAGCLNASAARKKLLKGRDLELKTFLPEAAQNNNGEVVLPPPPCKQRARSLDRASQRKLVRSYPSGGSITPTVLMSTSIVEDSFVAKRNGERDGFVEKRISRAEAPKRKEELMSPVTTHWSLSPARRKPEQHEWQLCLYMFGGREQGAPGVYRQPISVWKLYV